MGLISSTPWGDLILNDVNPASQASDDGNDAVFGSATKPAWRPHMGIDESARSIPKIAPAVYCGAARPGAIIAIPFQLSVLVTENPIKTLREQRESMLVVKDSEDTQTTHGFGVRISTIQSRYPLPEGQYSVS